MHTRTRNTWPCSSSSSQIGRGLESFRAGTTAIVNAGDRWQDEIDQALEEARVIVFLISPDFIASEYINGVEVKRAKERHAQGLARIIPVIVKDVFWEKNPLSIFQALPADGQSIAGASNKDRAFVEVVSGI